MRLPYLAAAFILVVVATAMILLVVSARAISWGSWPQILAFVALIVLASYLHAQDPAGGVVSSTGTLFYVAIYIFNPATAFLVVALGYAIGNTLPRGWVTWRACFNGAQMGLSAFGGSLAFRSLGGDASSQVLLSQILPSIAGPLAHQVANNFFIAVLISRIREAPFFRTWLSFVGEFFWSNLLSIPAAVLIAFLYTRVHHIFILTFLFSLPFQRWAMNLYLEERNSYTRIIESLVRASEMSLPGTRGHARRVADLSVAMGRKLSFIEHEIESLEYAALLHDVGMIGLDDKLTSDNAYLDPRPFIDAHTRAGAEIVSELPRSEVAEMVLNHHMNFAVEVLHRSAKARRPSVGSRIIALAEDVDSRLKGLFPYQNPYSLSSALDAVRRNRGSVFDPDVVDAFLAVYAEVLGLSERLLDGTVLGSISPGLANDEA